MALVHSILDTLGPSQPTSPRSTLELLPQEILLTIADSISLLSERLNFGLASSVIYSKVLCSVYTSVELDGVKQCKDTLRMFIANPGIARHVRKLAVHPDRHPHTKAPLYESSREFCADVSGFVANAARLMDALHTFVWDANGSLPDDYMWSQLREWCPELRNIATTFVQSLPNPSSNLFAFSDLTGFSLIYKGPFYTPYNFWSRETEPIFKKLWDMLILRSPNLRSLTIEGEWDEPLYQIRLLEAHWPYLRRLRLGPVRFDNNWPTLESTAPLLGFLERHPSIEDLSLVSVRIDMSRLSPYALPRLKTFGGYIDDLRGLTTRVHVAPGTETSEPERSKEPAQLSKTLHTLNILDPMMLRELTPLAVSGLLSGLHALTSLTIAFSLQNGYDSNGVLRTIVTACPRLTHLDLTCTCKPSLHLDAFSRTLSNLRKLRTLSLTTVKVPYDEPMRSGAARIALANPRLAHFSIAYIPPNKPIRRGYHPPRPLETGRFVLMCDQHGIPVRLLAWETWYRFRGIGGRASKRTVCELRPSGHPDAMKKGWLELLVARGPAGEEARLLLFSVLLVVLAVWGIAMGVFASVTRTRGQYLLVDVSP